MKKIVLAIMAMGILSSSLFAAESLVLYAHVDKESEKLTVIDKNSDELNENDEILIISEYGVKINRSGKFKKEDNTLCTNREKADEDKLCRSIFGTSTSAKAVANNSTYGVLGNALLAVISVGIVPATQGLTYYVYEDTDKLNEFTKNNNLEICISNLKEENSFKKKYADVADAINLNHVAYNDVNFVQKLNEQTSTLDKVLAQKRTEQEKIAAAKRAEQEKIAAAKRAEEEAQKAEQEKIAAAKRAEEEAQKAEQEKIAAAKKVENEKIAKAEAELFAKVEVVTKDGFGDVKKRKNCKVLLVKDEREVAEYYAQTWKNPKLFSMEYIPNNISRAVRADVASVAFQKYGNVDFNQVNLQGESFTLKSGLSQIALYISVENFCLDENIKKKHIQLLQAYMAANMLISVEDVNSGCRYWPGRAADIPVSIFNTLMFYKNSNKAAIKLLAILASDKTEEEKIKIIMKKPKVAEMFEIISK